MLSCLIWKIDIKQTENDKKKNFAYKHSNNDFVFRAELSTFFLKPYKLGRDFSREPELIPSKQMLTSIFHSMKQTHNVEDPARCS